MVTRYAAEAPVYWAAGWRAILPLPPGRKAAPPAGWTGHGSPYPGLDVVRRWRDAYPDGNLALRLPPTVLGVDVDAYDGKPGARSLQRLTALCGPLPATWESSSRDDGSGIRFYRVPAGIRWHERRAGPGIELIHAGHRYAVVWPSIHPQGRPYQWTAPDGAPATRPPRPDQLPALPPSWGRHLSQPAAVGTSGGSHSPGAGRAGSAYAAATLAAKVRDLAAMRSGQRRNNALNLAAYALGGFVAAGDLDERTVREQLLAAAYANGYVHKRGERQALRTIASGLRAGMARPRRGAAR